MGEMHQRKCRGWRLQILGTGEGKEFVQKHCGCPCWPSGAFKLASHVQGECQNKAQMDPLRNSLPKASLASPPSLQSRQTPG